MQLTNSPVQRILSPGPTLSTVNRNSDTRVQRFLSLAAP